MRLKAGVVDDILVGVRTNVMLDEVEVYTGQKSAITLDERMSSSVFSGNLLDRDGTVYMAKTCQVQEESRAGERPCTIWLCRPGVRRR